MTTEPSPLDYNGTLNRLEAGIAPVELQISMASIAISLKRLVDIEANRPQQDSNWVLANNIIQAINGINLRR